MTARVRTAIGAAALAATAAGLAFWAVAVALALTVCVDAAKAEENRDCQPIIIGDKIFSCEPPVLPNKTCPLGKHDPKKKLLPQWRRGGGAAGTGLCWAIGHDPRYGEPPCAIDVGNNPDGPDYGHVEKCSESNYSLTNPKPPWASCASLGFPAWMRKHRAW
jgi:hypothetical protein